ncbi:MAG: hypothetical protein ACJ8AW_51200 [Rhodopila sp.]
MSETFLCQHPRRSTAETGNELLPGDWVEVRSFTEIRATLDEKASLEAMPFMPEMVQYCGQRFRVVKSAHKTCHPTGASDLRRMNDAVHLETRCDGSEHDGCDARCLLFWKTAWLKLADGPAQATVPTPAPDAAALALLQRATRASAKEGGERYRCQVTEIVAATVAIPNNHLRHYFEDVARRNIPVTMFVRHTAETFWKRAVRKLTRVMRLGNPHEAPGLLPPAGAARQQATALLNLRPGEWVRVRPAEEIKATLNKNWKNRGLVFEQEMLRYCGKTYRVLGRVNRLIDEKSGKMIRLVNDCIILEGPQCAGLDNYSRLFCPRSPYFYWREAWLERVAEPEVRMPAWRRRQSEERLSGV